MPIFSPEALARHAAAYEAQQAEPVEQDRTYQHVGRPSVWGGNAADLASTLWALQQSGRPTADGGTLSTSEANPMFGGSTALIALGKLAAAAGEDALLSKLSKHHPKLAAGVGLGIGALNGGIALRNVKATRDALKGRD